ncbi:ABC transporter permease [Paenibacillus sp. 7124]|uniref:ABC transporter permease n=1 Tax=Paenibacillus apii TaxID=1850370 RepID=A0A6M1PPQ9_9BACL|nr:ABC transporter permease [Paenibacillus apii]NGM85260.1 ABC transporter permease [Paenibacillus apii]
MKLSDTAGLESPDKKKKIKGNIAFEAIGLFVFYMAITLFFSASTENFFSTSNALNILDNASVLGIVAIGQTFALITGGFDLSVGGIVPLGAVMFVVFSNSGIDPYTSILLVILIGGLVGFINGVFITRFKINPLITTLATLSITAGLAKVITGGLTTILEDLDAAVLAGRNAGVPNHVWILAVLAVLGFYTLKYTKFGRSLYAMGGNKEASRLAGIRVDLTTVIVYIICGVLAAFAGIVLASQLMAGSGTMGSTYNLDSITAVILGGGSLTGGQGGVIGTIVGVLILGTLSNGMAIMQVQTFYQEIVTGIVLLLAVNFNNIRAAWINKIQNKRGK